MCDAGSKGQAALEKRKKRKKKFLSEIEKFQSFFRLYRYSNLILFLWKEKKNRKTKRKEIFAYASTIVSHPSRIIGGRARDGRGVSGIWMVVRSGDGGISGNSKPPMSYVTCDALPGSQWDSLLAVQLSFPMDDRFARQRSCLHQKRLQHGSRVRVSFSPRVVVRRAIVASLRS